MTSWPDLMAARWQEGSRTAGRYQMIVDPNQFVHQQEGGPATWKEDLLLTTSPRGGALQFSTDL